jgi:hypothetical protein
VRDSGWALDSLCTVEVDGPFEMGKAVLVNAMLNWRLAPEAPRLDVFISHREDAHAPLYFKVTCRQPVSERAVGWRACVRVCVPDQRTDRLRARVLLLVWGVGGWVRMRR